MRNIGEYMDNGVAVWECPAGHVVPAASVERCYTCGEVRCWKCAKEEIWDRDHCEMCYEERVYE